MGVQDKSGNGIVTDVGGATQLGWSLWHSTVVGDGVAIPWPGGRGTAVVSGTLGGGSVTIKSLFLGKSPQTSITVDNRDQLNITAPGTYLFELGRCSLVANVSGTLAGADISVGITGTGYRC